MKVALLYPELSDYSKFKENRKEFPPFGIMYLAAAIEKCGIKIKLFNVDSYTLN